MSLDLANNKSNFGEKVRDGKSDYFFLQALHHKLVF